MFNSFDYFLGDGKHTYNSSASPLDTLMCRDWLNLGGDCEPDLDDDFSLDEENDEVNGEEEIDLEDEEVERPKKRMRKN